MDQPLYNRLSLLRAPLLLNVFVGLVITATLVSNDNNYFWIVDRPNFLAPLLAFYVCSFVATAALGFIDYVQRRPISKPSRYLVSVTLTKAALDLVFAIAFLEFHIEATKFLDHGREHGSSEIARTMYIGFGALTACVFHVALFVQSVLVILRESRVRCLSCARSVLPSSPDDHSPVVGRVARLSWPKWKTNVSIPNEEGNSEGDRLVAVNDNDEGTSEGDRLIAVNDNDEGTSEGDRLIAVNDNDNEA